MSQLDRDKTDIIYKLVLIRGVSDML